MKKTTKWINVYGAIITEIEQLKSGEIQYKLGNEYHVTDCFDTMVFILTENGYKRQ